MNLFMALHRATIPIQDFRRAVTTFKIIIPVFFVICVHFLIIWGILKMKILKQKLKNGK